jgi:hypothetical protein
MASFVKSMADNTEAAYPSEERLLLLTDNIQAHYVVLQYGVDERVCLPAANLTANKDELLPRCNMDVSRGPCYLVNHSIASICTSMYISKHCMHIV